MRRPNNRVNFWRGTSDHSFDFAVMMLFIHELNEQHQQMALEEALRVAKKIIICDAASPQEFISNLVCGNCFRL